MAITENLYTGNGSTTNYSFTFPYISETDVKVSLDAVDTTAYTFANATTIQFNTAPADGAAIRIYRRTDDSELSAEFYPGSAIRAQDLNDNFTQNLYVTQETRRDVADAVAGQIPDGAIGTSKLADGAVTDIKVTNIGSAKTTFTQTGTGAVQRTVESKLQDVVSVKDFGAVGDGVTDDTAAIQAANNAALAAGVSLLFDASDTYLVTSISLSAPTIITGGAVISPSASASATSPAVSVLTTTRFIDSINVQQSNTIRKRAVVLSSAQDLTIDSITIVSSNQNDYGGSTNNAALRIYECSNVSIGRLFIDKFDYAVKVFGATEFLSIGCVRIRSYINGINLQQGIGITLGGSGGLDIQQLSSNWVTQQPGQNGILIGNESGVNGGTSHIKIINAHIRDSGEHGVRIGGAHEVHHVTFESPVIGNIQGTGLKIFSGDDGIYTRYVTINSPRIYDAVGGGIKLSCGMMIYRTIKCTINSPVIYKVSHTYCGLHGISLYDVSELTITTPLIQNAEQHGISVRLVHDNASGTPITKDCNQVLISGGTISLCAGDGINIPTQGAQHRRWSVTDTLLQFNTGYGFNINSDSNPTIGQVDYGYFSTIGRANTAGHANVATGNTSKLSFALRGQYSAALTCANGSTQQDTDNGTFYLRKGGVWTAL